MATDSNRTPSGDVSAAARKKFGGTNGEYPVFDTDSAVAAVNLRGHSGDPSKILAKVSRYATAHNDAKAKKAVADARKTDQGN